MERSIAELETYLRDLDDSSREGNMKISDLKKIQEVYFYLNLLKKYILHHFNIADDNEWKVRFESQTAQNKQLQEQRDWLETELSEARRKLTTGSYPEAMNFNLDALNEVSATYFLKLDIFLWTIKSNPLKNFTFSKGWAVKAGKTFGKNA